MYTSHWSPDEALQRYQDQAADCAAFRGRVSHFAYQQALEQVS
jgi:hypothetical protein